MTKAKDVHILVTCRKEELKDYSYLVFKTIRVGFPTARIHVHFNDLPISEAVAASQLKFESVNTVSTIHHEWIEHLISANTEPFWIVDTDMIFYESVEDWEFEAPLAGYRIPEFKDPFTGCITRSRLHTSLMYIDPVRVGNLVNEYASQINPTQFNPKCPLVYPLVTPFNGKPYFNDTMSMLYHAIGGTEFTDAQKDAYFHFHFGTLSDLVFKRIADFSEVRKEILNNPDRGRGIWRDQDAYFESMQPNHDGKNVIAEIKPEDAEVAREWNKKLCCGNEDAMRFCDLWYGYVHGIDDLVDCSKDGRPLMSKRQMISLFWHAALLYNNNFYRANQALLFPLVLDITNSYTTSVEWEKSPIKHRRQIADLLRMAGNRMYSMVALICGGEAHSQNINQVLHEKDWLGQHDKHGNPT